ncbi:hypothetical protein B0T19DRAFT_404369 [Cercophora scortea]|uniref:Uncharacterized protein n=1 Tax=Cercophora scortea TaxID=314031 RepID=A0AAE0M562_9PEZI|nr:hypothetical protein B0T19DRAFT_404369 [Cercophora scortea]
MSTHVSGQGSVTGRASSSSNALGTALPSSTSQCDTWIGIEVIYMMEITEICPEGATIKVTETITECVATMTRSICQTSATNYPCYPCIMGSPASSEDTATVTVTSCSASTEATVTITVQLCSTCTTSTYIGTVPGYTPGGPCHDCTSYQPTSSSPPSPTVETINETATATVIDSTDCTESDTPPPTNSPEAPSLAQHSESKPHTSSPEPTTTDNTPNLHYRKHSTAPRANGQYHRSPIAYVRCAKLIRDASGAAARGLFVPAAARRFNE